MELDHVAIGKHCYSVSPPIATRDGCATHHGPRKSFTTAIALQPMTLFEPQAYDPSTSAQIARSVRNPSKDFAPVSASTACQGNMAASAACRRALETGALFYSTVS